jgi:hypothetical protein
MYIPPQALNAVSDILYVTKATNGKDFLQYSHTFLNDSKFFSSNPSVITHGDMETSTSH